jgi:hypothetical protein
MKKCLFSIYLLLLVVLFAAPFTIFCASDQTTPEKVYSVVYVQKPNEWYIKQAELWKQEIDKNPKDTEAWHNYYNAVRYARYSETIKMKEKKQRLKKIIEDMGKAIPESYEYHYLKFKTHYDISKIEDLEKAYKIDPNRSDTYSDFVCYYEIQGQEDKRNEFLAKLYHSQDLAPSLLNYNYNTLMSTESNAILITNGDNDTYPVWILQKIKGIRTDVTILNASLMMVSKEYLGRKLREKRIKINYDELPKYRSNEFVSGLARYISKNYSDIPVYFATTVWSQYTNPVKEDLYLTGLAYRYRETRFDNIAHLKQNLEKKLRLDYLANDWYDEEYLITNLMHRYNCNYIPSMVMLAEHYKASGEMEKSNKWRDFSLKIAEAGGIKDDVLEDLRKKDL